jgi:tRNA dimethylallyltransferase
LERKVIVIAGPTCSGKTALSLMLASQLNSEIISADSRQVFKYLDIGSAKPSKEELSKAPHHFIDNIYPDQEFNASIFETESLAIINKLHQQNKIPVVAGGSGLYIKALVDGIFDAASSDENYREELKNDMELYGKEYLYNKLKELDPVSAGKMLPQNWKRVMRALETLHVTGEPIWKAQQQHIRSIDIDFLQYGLDWDRSVLYANIEKRVDDMIEAGLIDEVKHILSLGYSKSLNALNTVGYKEIISYLENEITLDRAIELIKRNTRRFAKRQLTWFRADARITWIRIGNQDDIRKAAYQILRNG